MSEQICRHCPTASHGTIICDCHHHHNDHNFAGGCLMCAKDKLSQRHTTDHQKDGFGCKPCKCEHYSQEELYTS
jgi:hypothetical protein